MTEQKQDKPESKPKVAMSNRAGALLVWSETGWVSSMPDKATAEKVVRAYIEYSALNTIATAAEKVSESIQNGLFSDKLMLERRALQIAIQDLAKLRS